MSVQPHTLVTLPPGMSLHYPLNRRMGVHDGAHLDILKWEESLAHGSIQTLDQPPCSLITVLTLLVPPLCPLFCTKLKEPCSFSTVPDGLINLWEPCYSTNIPDDPQPYTLDVLWLQEEEGFPAFWEDLIVPHARFKQFSDWFPENQSLPPPFSI